jgi:hypothetical protein
MPRLRALFLGRGWRDTLVLIAVGVLAGFVIWHAVRTGRGWAGAIGMALAVVAYLFAPWLKPLRAKQDAARLEKLYGTVTIDDWGVTRVAGKLREAVAWADLIWVAIETTDAGPYAEDFFFLLGGADGKGVVVPNFLATKLNLLATLQARLPDLDNAQVAVAVGSTSNAMFKIWERPPVSAPPARDPQ